MNPMRIFKLPKVDSIEDRTIDTSPKANETKYDKSTHDTYDVNAEGKYNKTTNKAAEKTRLDADMERSRLVDNVEFLTQSDIAVVEINSGLKFGKSKGAQLTAKGEVDIAN